MLTGEEIQVMMQEKISVAHVVCIFKVEPSSKLCKNFSHNAHGCNN